MVETYDLFYRVSIKQSSGPFHNGISIDILDKAKLKTLGPFAKAIFRVLGCGVWSDEKRLDAIEQGV